VAGGGEVSNGWVNSHAGGGILLDYLEAIERLLLQEFETPACSEVTKASTLNCLLY
jgi:hypothetical protein